jgi:transcriptional regulator with XRE-family HTH domain
MTLGARIKQHRQALGITQQDLAKATQITLQHVSAIEQNKRTPSLPLLIQLSEYLNSSLDYLVLGKQTRIDTVAAINADDSLDTEEKKSLINLVNVMRDTKRKQPIPKRTPDKGV